VPGPENPEMMGMAADRGFIYDSVNAAVSAGAVRGPSDFQLLPKERKTGLVPILRHARADSEVVGRQKLSNVALDLG